jgi:predicted DNA-binding protein
MREKEKMTETVTIRMTPTVKAALQALADGDRRKLASYLSLVLEEHAEQTKPNTDKPKSAKAAKR